MPTARYNAARVGAVGRCGRRVRAAASRAATLGALLCLSCTAWLLGGVEESRSAVAVGPDEFLEARAAWRARRSFDPLSGTTLKSDYRAEFRRLRIQDGRAVEFGEPARFRGWILPEFSVSCGDYVFFVGGEREGPGVPPASVYRVRPGASAAEVLYTSETAAIESLLLSPDRAAFALRLASAPEGVRLVMLESGPCDAPELRIRTTASILREHIQSGPAWSRDGRTLYFESREGYFAVNRAGAIQASNLRPARWSPASDQGGPINSAGISLYFDPDQQKYEIQRDPDWIPFERMQYEPSRQ